jgi:chaperone modulatory protein CbpM
MMPGQEYPDLGRWILKQWVKPDEGCGEIEFCEIDVARARLIRDLRDDIEGKDAALPAALLLLDQVYDLRRRMHDISEAIDKTVPPDVLVELVEHLAKRKSESGNCQSPGAAR